MVYLAISVPRSKLGVLSSRPADEVGTPGLHVSILYQDEGMTNLFFAMNGFFGKLHPIGQTPFSCAAEIDRDGWMGTSDMIVTCPVPIFALMLGDPRQIQIYLEINISPITLLQFGEDLGLLLRLFEVGIQDSRVWILNQPPGFNRVSEADAPRVTSERTELDGSYALHLRTNGIARDLAHRSNFVAGSVPAALLSNGEQAKVSRASPCSFVLKLGDFAWEIFYHYPLFGIARKVRHARSSFWVEVLAAVHFPSNRGGYDPERFPVITCDRNVMQWALSNVDLNKLPRVSDNQDLTWLALHLGMSTSAEERTMTNSNRETTLVRLKMSILTIFEAFAGYHMSSPGHSVQAFKLLNEKNDCDTVILVKDLLYDNDTGSVVLDARLICLNGARAREMDPQLLKVLFAEAFSLHSLPDEELLWKHLIPALVERCRLNEWEHRSDCSYLSSENVPLSTQHGELPICDCGDGQASFDGINPVYAPMKKYGVRIALAPVAAVPFVEDIGGFNDVPNALKAYIQKEQTKKDNSGDVPSCSYCGEKGKQLKPCKSCRQAGYCSHKCQKAAWQGHKKECERARRNL